MEEQQDEGIKMRIFTIQPVKIAADYFIGQKDTGYPYEKV